MLSSLKARNMVYRTKWREVNVASWTFLNFLRRVSSESGNSRPEYWLQRLNVNNVPSKLFTVRYDRSSGPGGQNVNKVNSKCTLTLNDFSKCSWLPDEIRQQLVEKKFRYYAKRSDSLVIQSDETRSREINRQTCLAKLVTEIKNCCWFPGEVDKKTVQKWENIREKADKERIRRKKLNSERKKLRGKMS